MTFQSYIQRFLPADDQDKSNVVEFFILFSRFEFAMKSSGFWHIRNNRYNNGFEPHWEVIDGSNGLIHELISAGWIPDYTEYSELIWICPRRQLWKNHWSDAVPGTKDIPCLIRSLRMVRNNLFHWWKFSDGPIEWTERNRNLIVESKHLLSEILRFSENSSNPKLVELSSRFAEFPC